MRISDWSSDVCSSDLQSSVSGEPVESVYQTLLYAHGLWASVCAVAALIEREGSGFGQRVTVSGINALQQLTMISLVVDPNAPDPSTAVGGAGQIGRSHV